MVPLTKRKIDFLNRALDTAIAEEWIGHVTQHGQIRPEDQEMLSLVNFCK